MPNPLSLLQQRHSVPSRQLGDPAPDAATLRALLEASIRVPDHGKLVPFRLLKMEAEAKLRFGEELAQIAARNNSEMSESKREKERLRYTFAPLVVVVIACLDPHSKVPTIEQKLSAGCVAHNILLGASSLGFGAQWLTGWAAYDAEVAALLGLKPHEAVIGFIHVGTAQIDVPDRGRPALADVLGSWSP
jgi:nitroreductase